MKNIILLIAVVIVVGCGKDNQTAKEAPKETPSNNSTAKPTKDKTNKETPPKEDAKKATPPEGDDNNSTEIKPRKLTAEEEKVAGGYERIINEDGDTIRKVLLENGNTEGYVIPSLDNSYKTGEKNKWSISKEGEIHVINDFGMIEVYRINKDVSITLIAWIYKGLKRGDIPKEEQVTFKKIKLDTAAENKKHNVVVGSYERNVFDFDTFKLVLLENGKSETWKNGEKRFGGTWEIASKDVHVVFEKYTAVYKIEPNGDLTWIEVIEDGKREKYPKEKQRTWKKLSEAENKRQKAWLENNYVVGTYEAKIEEDTITLLTINKRNESTWKIVGKEVHVEGMFDSKIRRLQELRTKVYRIEANGDLTAIANIGNGKRTDLPKKEQVTFKKTNWQSTPKRD